MTETFTFSGSEVAVILAQHLVDKGLMQGGRVLVKPACEVHEDLAGFDVELTVVRPESKGPPGEPDGP